MMKFITLFEMSLAGLAVLIGIWCDVAPFRSMRIEGWGDWVRQTLVGAGAAFLPLAVVWGLSRLRYRGIVRIHDWLKERIGIYLRDTHWVDLASLSLAAGFGEEALFRGLIQAGLSEYLLPHTSLAPMIALFLASVFFGLMHWASFSYFVFATVMGAILGGVFFYTEQLWVVVVLHAVYDFVALLALRHAWYGKKQAT